MVQTHKYFLLIQINTFSILYDIKLSFNDININIDICYIIFYAHIDF